MQEINVNDILEHLNQLAPPETAFEWDNVGIMVGSKQKTVKKVLVTLDVSLDAVDEAAQKGCDLIVSHHPLIFNPLKSVTDMTPTGKAVIDLVKNDISVVSMHTNLDKANDGVAFNFAKSLGLEGIYKSPLDKLEVVHCGTVKQQTNFEDFVQTIGEKLGTKAIRFSKNNDFVKKVATGCGAGYGIPESVVKEGVDTFVVGEAKYNDYLDSAFYGINIIDVGHFASENVVVPVLQKKLEQAFQKVEFIISTEHKDAMSSL